VALTIVEEAAARAVKIFRDIQNLVTIGVGEGRFDEERDFKKRLETTPLATDLPPALIFRQLLQRYHPRLRLRLVVAGHAIEVARQVPVNIHSPLSPAKNTEDSRPSLLPEENDHLPAYNGPQQRGASASTAKQRQAAAESSASTLARQALADI